MPAEPIVSLASLGDPLGAFQKSYGLAQGFADDAALRRAGLAIASGDYGGASRTLGAAGMLDKESLVSDLATKAQQRELLTAGRKLLLQTDPTAPPAAAAAPTGLPDLSGVHPQAIATAAQSADNISGFVDGLSKLPYEQRKPLINANAPALVAHGFTADQVAAFDPTDANLATVSQDTAQARAHFGSAMPSATAASGGSGIDLRRDSRALSLLALGGMNVDPLVSIAKAAQPDLVNVNGMLVDQHDQNNTNRFVPNLDKGQEFVYDANRNIVGVKTLAGAIQSTQELARAQAEGTQAATAKYAGPIADAQQAAQARYAGPIAGAQATARAPYEFEEVPTTNGAPRKVAKSVAAGGDFTGQTPAAAAQQTASAAAAVGLPQTIQDSTNALALISTLKSHPALGDRTGIKGILPAIPGTPGADFDAIADQLKGKVFLTAYSGLRGGGSITEVEGAKAENAIARLTRNQSGPAYKQALTDLGTVLQQGVDRAKAQAAKIAAPAPTTSNAGLRQYSPADWIAAARAAKAAQGR